MGSGGNSSDNLAANTLAGNNSSKFVYSSSGLSSSSTTADASSSSGGSSGNAKETSAEEDPLARERDILKTLTGNLERELRVLKERYVALKLGAKNSSGSNIGGSGREEGGGTCGTMEEAPRAAAVNIFSSSSSSEGTPADELNRNDSSGRGMGFADENPAEAGFSGKGGLSVMKGAAAKGDSGLVFLSWD